MYNHTTIPLYIQWILSIDKYVSMLFRVGISWTSNKDPFQSIYIFQRLISSRAGYIVDIYSLFYWKSHKLCFSTSFPQY